MQAAIRRTRPTALAASLLHASLHGPSLHNEPAPSAAAPRTGPPSATPGSDDGTSIRTTSRWRPAPSTDIPCAERKRSRLSPGSRKFAADRRQTGASSWAVGLTAPCVTLARRVSCQWSIRTSYGHRPGGTPNVARRFTQNNKYCVIRMGY